MKSQKRFYFILLFFCLLAAPVLAVISQLFTSDSNLSCSLINDVFYDKNGFLWIATEDGLNRCDGSKFTVYKHDNDDPHSLASNYAACVWQDERGHILIGTYDGLQIYDALHDRFSTLATIQSNGQEFRGTVRRIMQLRNGETLAIGDEVMTVKVESDKEGEHAVMMPYPVPKEVTAPNAAIQDNDGYLWFSCDMRGIYRVDKKNSKKARHYFGSGDTKIEVFHIGSDQKLYAGTTNSGIWVYDKQGDTFKQLFRDTPNAKLHVKHMLTTSDGNIIVSTDGQGVHAFNPHQCTIEEYNLPFPDGQKLKVHKTIKDEWGNLWLAIYQKGVGMIPYQSYGFMSLRQNTPPNNLLIGTSCITSILKDSDGSLWIGTDNDGLYQLSPDMKESCHHTNVPSTIMSIFADSKSNLWIGSYGNGVGILDRKSGNYRNLVLSNNKGVYGNNIYDFVEDDQHNIWIATMGGGLFIYTNEGKIVYDEQINKVLNPWITSVVFSPGPRNLYVGTYNGVFKIKLDSKKVTQLCDKLIINKMLCDPEKHMLWAATSTGLAKICRDRSKNRTYTTNDGLPSNTIYGIETNNKVLWLSTNHGLSRFNIKGETFTNFFVEDGLNSNEFYKNASWCGNDGTLYFGGINGFTYFKPSEVGVSSHRLAVRLTDFYVRDMPVRGDMKSGGQLIINTPISEAKEFNLCYDDNSFSVEFTTRQPINSSQLEYLYSFDDEGWKAIPQQQVKHLMQGGNILNFTNVVSGSHTLRIKARCNETESQELELRIYVAPPWYASWWAKLIYFVIILAIIYYVYRRVQDRAEQKRQELINKHEAEISESKLRFFTNISHEIRTPLSLVLSPLEKLMSSDKDFERQRSYKTMFRNATRILKLVNELMDLRKIDNGHMKLKFSEVNLTDFVQDLYDTFEQAAIQKDITFTFNHDGQDDLKIWVDPSNFDKILVNLLSNAFKYTDKNGDIDISITTGTDESINGPLAHYAEIAVSDTGIGIPVEARTRIFERFYQVGVSKTSGTGIGLHLTSLLVNLHHGTISVADNPRLNAGIRFNVRIPLGNDHLTADELAMCNSVKDNSAPSTRDALKPLNPASADIATLIGDEPPVKTNSKPKSNKLVYLAEDDKEIQDYLSSYLGENYKLRCFENGEEVLNAMHHDCPDLLITDVMMPKMDGYTLTRKIRQNINLNHVPIIILTAKTRDDEQLEGLEVGADAYLTKPFNIDILHQTAENLIALRQQLRNVYNGNQDREHSVDKINVVSNDEKLMDKIMQVVNQNLANPDLTIETLAKEVGISRVHLHRKLKELTNQSSSHFIRNLRLKQAAQILSEKQLNVSEVCYMVGFKHPNNFSVVFKEMYGMSPTAYAEAHNTRKKKSIDHSEENT